MSQFTGLLSATGLGSMGVVSPSVTPNAVNWTNVGQLGNPIITIGQQITGITTPITLKINATGGYSIYGGYYGVNTIDSTPGVFTQIIPDTGFPGFQGDSDTFVVSNNDWLFFQFYRQQLCSETTISVINVSDSNAVLDTFTIIFYNRITGTCP